MTHLRHGRPHRIRGWGLIKTRASRLSVRRYMRLIHYTLTVFDAADEHSDLVIFEQVLVGATVSVVKRRREIQIKFPNDRLVVQLRTDKEYHAWHSAFVDAARLADAFYKIVNTRQLGHGAFSTVYFGFDRDDGHHVAIKVVDKTRCSRAELAYAETEARMMAFVRHPSIVLCRDIFDAPHAMHVVMEYMSGSTLEHRMLSLPSHQRRFSESTAATVMAHILSALTYLDEQRICHRDIKPENILLAALTNDSLWPTSARLSDFGLAAFIDTDLDLTDIVGTPNYVAPEVISRDHADNERLGYGPPVDVWASGILLHWMLTGGVLPFDGPDSAAIFRAVRGAQLSLDTPPWHDISADGKSLLRGLLHPNPLTRLCASAARVHPWLLRAQQATPLCTAAHAKPSPTTELTSTKPRKSCAYMRWMMAIRAVIAFVSLCDTIDPAAVAERRAARSERLARLRSVGMSKNTSLEEKMAKAPERAPVGADGLGYNVGLIPSFAPKRRARAGVTARLEFGGGRQSGESASSGSRGVSADRGVSGDRTVSTDRQRSMDRKVNGGERGVSADRRSVERGSLGGKTSSWGLRLLRGSGESSGSG